MARRSYRLNRLQMLAVVGLLLGALSITFVWERVSRVFQVRRQVIAKLQHDLEQMLGGVVIERAYHDSYYQQDIEQLQDETQDDRA